LAIKAVDTPKSSAIAGSAGKYISIDNGPIATISPSIIIQATGSSDERTRSAAIGFFEREDFGADIVRTVYDYGVKDRFIRLRIVFTSKHYYANKAADNPISDCLLLFQWSDNA
jgi:hypothetical protein